MRERRGKKGKKKRGRFFSLSLSPHLHLPLSQPYNFLTDPQAPPDVRPGDPPKADLPLNGLGAEDRHEDLEDAQRRRDEDRGRDGDRREEPSGLAQQAERQAHGGQHAGKHQRRGGDGPGDRRPVGDLPQRRRAEAVPVGR